VVQDEAKRDAWKSTDPHEAYKVLYLDHLEEAFSALIGFIHKNHPKARLDLVGRDGGGVVYHVTNNAETKYRPFNLKEHQDSKGHVVLGLYEPYDGYKTIQEQLRVVSSVYAQYTDGEGTSHALEIMERIPDAQE
jgi:hypothetical protein